MKNNIKQVIAGFIFISTLAVSTFSYADINSMKLESDIKKLQNDIKNIQKTQVQLELELSKFKQATLSPEYSVVTSKKICSRGRR